MGFLTQALSEASENDGTAGVARFTKAQCPRSRGVYVPSGAISETIASETSITPEAKSFKHIAVPPSFCLQVIPQTPSYELGRIIFNGLPQVNFMGRGVSAISKQTSLGRMCKPRRNEGGNHARPNQVQPIFLSFKTSGGACSTTGIERIFTLCLRPAAKNRVII